MNSEYRNTNNGRGTARRTRPSERRMESRRRELEEVYHGGNEGYDSYDYDDYEERPVRKRTRRRKKNSFLKKLLVLLLLVALGFGIWTFASPYLGEKYWTVAVFGVDSRDGSLEKGALSDVIMVASINRRDGSVKLTSMYRDTYTEVNSEGKYHKLNEAYFLGGHEQAVEALERNFDLKIDDYVTFNWAAVAKAITALGGVDLEISDSEFKYINAFITETVNSTGLGSVQLEHAGMNHLDGVQAVAYGRLRLMDTDFNRTARQRKVLSLAMAKAKQANAKTLADVARYVFPEVSTSMGLDDIVSIARNVKKYEIVDSQGFPFARTTKKIGKMDCVIAGTLASNVVQLQNYLYGTEDYKVSSTVQKISDHIQEKSGVGVLDNAPEVTVGSSNKNGGASAAASEKKPAANGEKPQAQPEPSAAAEPSSEAVTETAAETETESTEESLESSEESREDELESVSVPEESEESMKETETKESIEETKKEGGAVSFDKPETPESSAPKGEEDAAHGPGAEN